MEAPEVINMLEAYKLDHNIRALCNSKGIYVSFEDNVTITQYLTEGIDSSSEYHELSELAVSLTQEDQLIFLINNGGGYLSGAQMLTRIIGSCNATTIAIVIDMAASAATIVALQVDELLMEPFSYFMIHAPTWGEYPKKMHELQASAEFAIPYTKKYVASMYKDFLTDEEITNVVNGGDIYLTAEDVTERFLSIKQRRESEYLEQEQEHIKEHIEHLKANLTMLEDRLPKEETPKPKPKRTKKSS